MNVLIIIGSRNLTGQTASAADAILQGIMEAGGSGEQVFLPQMDMERCRQCEDNGWGQCIEQGSCTVEDDLPMVISKIRSSDAVVFATPVYFSDLSESMRAFLDRLRRTARHDAGKAGIAGKPVVGICVAGGGGGGAPSCCWNMEKILSTCGFDVLDMIPARRQNLEMKMDVLKVVGAWLAQMA